MNKILVIKKDKNIFLYGLTFNENSMKDYIEYLRKKYSEIVYTVINATIKDNTLINIGKYAYAKDQCTVGENFEIVNEIGTKEDGTKVVDAKIRVDYFSKIAKILEELFFGSSMLINSTNLIKLINHLNHERNSFEFSKVIDLKDKAASDWYAIDSSILGTTRYEEYRRTNINTDRVTLNNKELKKLKDDVLTIKEELLKQIVIEQIGMFPIEENMKQFNYVLTEYGKRNTELGYILDNELEIAPVTNSNKLIEDLRSEIKNNYAETVEDENSEKKQAIKEFIKKFLSFKN